MRLWWKRAAGIHNGIDTRQWLKHVHDHMRHMERAIARGDVEMAETQAACVRNQLSMLMRSIGRSGFSGDVKSVERITGNWADGGETVTLKWISDHEAWERSKQFAENRKRETAEGPNE